MKLDPNTATLEDLVGLWIGWGANVGDWLIWIGVPVGLGLSLWSAYRLHEINAQAGNGQQARPMGAVLGICVGGIITIFSVVTGWFSQFVLPF